MKALDRHILKNILLPALLAFGVITFLGAASKVGGYSEEIPQGFLTPLDFFRLITFMLPELVTLLVPVAYFLGILMAFGRMAQQGEITAMQASGISLKRMALPVVITGIILSVFAYLVQDYGRPWGMGRLYHIVYTEIPQRATIDQLDAGELHEYNDGYRIYFSDKNMETHTLYNFDMIAPSSDGADVALFHAEEAQLNKVDGQYILVLKNMYWVPNNSSRLLQNEEFNYPFPMPEQVQKTNIQRYGVNLTGLLKHEKSTADIHKANPQSGLADELHKTRGEIANRLSLPFAVIAIALVGAPLGVQARQRGKSSLFSMGFGVMVVYYTLLTIAEPTSNSELHEYILRAWIPNLVLMGIGALMLWKVDRV